MRRVAVTGLGAITPLGNNVKELWAGVQAGTCGIAPITHYDTTGRKVTLAGEVKNFVPEQFLDKGEARKMDRFAQFAVAASKEAVADAGLDFENEDRDRCGVMVASGIGGITTIQNECEKGGQKGFDRISPHFIPMGICNMAAGHIAIAHKLNGMCTCPVTACAAGTNAIGDDVLKLECEIISRKGPVGIGKAIATIDEKIAVIAELVFAIDQES